MKRTNRVDVMKTIVDTTEIAKSTYGKSWGLGFFLAPIAMGVSIGSGAGIEVVGLIGLLAFSVGINLKKGKKKSQTRASEVVRNAID